MIIIFILVLNYKDLQEITIDLEKIDRLYDIYHQDDDDDEYNN